MSAKKKKKQMQQNFSKMLLICFFYVFGFKIYFRFFPLFLFIRVVRSFRPHHKTQKKKKTNLLLFCFCFNFYLNRRFSSLLKN